MSGPKASSLDSEHPARKRLLLLIILRFLICFLGLLYLNLSYIQTFSTIRPHYMTLFGGCGVNLIYLIWLKYGRWYRALSFTQIFVDLILEGIIVYLTGGVLFSVFSFLFFATVLYTPLYTGPRYGMLSASFATILLSAISLAYFLSTEIPFQLPYVQERYLGLFTRELNFVLPYLASFGFSLHLVGYLAGHLVRRVGLQEFLTREILENMREGVAAVDTQGRLYVLNEIAERYLDLRDTQLGKPKRIEKLRPETFWSTVYRSVREGRGGRWDVAVPHRQGRQKHLEVTLSSEPVQLSGHFTQENVFFLFLRDITPRIEAERQRRRAEKLETVSNLGASIAHEIRNPLSSIQSAIQKVRNDQAAKNRNTDNHQLLDIMTRETKRVNRIITDFLDFSKDKEINRTNVEVRTLLETVGRMTKLSSEDCEVDMQFDLEEELTMNVDRDKVKQVFYNLLNNALEHADNGGTVVVEGFKEARRTLTKKARGEHTDHRSIGTTFRILDDGPGIPKEELDHIFEPFYSCTEDGTGLGLAISSQIVHRHSGTIEARRRTGGGTCFELWIPDRSIPADMNEG